MIATIHERLAEDWITAGIAVIDTAPSSGRRNAPNPTQVSILTGPGRQVPYLVFAWNITHEGRGRPGDNLRVQATSFGKGNSRFPVDRSVLSIGWSDQYGVYVGFDPWVKRNPGSSSSVHIKRALLEAAASKGEAYGGHAWDPRVALRPEHAANLLPWSARLWNPKTVCIEPLNTTPIGADYLQITVDPWSSEAAWGVRPRDRLTVVDSNRDICSPYLWRVEHIGEIPVQRQSNLNRFYYSFRGTKSARVLGVK